MNHEEWLYEQSQITLSRLLDRCQSILAQTDDAIIFHERLNQEFPRLFALLHHLYGGQYDFFYHLEQMMRNMAQMFVNRPAELKALDRHREADLLWYQSGEMVGAVCYVDLFAGDLTGMKSKIPYLKELGVNYLHLMPLFESPEKNSDGGYAVSNYRAVNPKLGTMEQLADLASEFRREGISLVVDFVFNHTSNEHEWAKRALAGERDYQNFYYIFPDRTMPDAYERNLREIFPEQAPGNFTYSAELNQWVWTSFYNFQWDLNYGNPAVFNAMMGEMLFLANQGVEVLRLDAVAFIWKQMGTTCESLPEAHQIIQAYNAITRIVAPAMLFKSEAIVHPDIVATYISLEESPISYNPTLMALLWEALATRNVNLLQLSMARRFTLPEGCTWVNYVRVHDDIGWTFADEDASELWINGYNHRQFLNRFYTGAFEGSFAKGLPFNYNPRTGDMRISGTGASLAGLESAIEQENEELRELALRRILLIYSVIISAGGIPLIYLGDEIATINDYSYRSDLDKKDDSRWVHRPVFDWKRAERRVLPRTPESIIFQGLVKMLMLRKTTPALGRGMTTFIPTQNPHVLGYIRSKSLLILANFSEQPQIVDRRVLNAYADLEHPIQELLSDEVVEYHEVIELAPYEFKWLAYNR